jgi:ACS family hexuronate transporter-like MFS transporter
LLFATALSYLDRQALGIVGPQVKQELGLDNASFAPLLSAFFYAYGLMHLFVGFILDRGNLRFVYPAFVALWSCAQMLSGLARGFAGLFGARLLLGGFEAAAQPGAARIIARILPPEHRPLGNGIMMSGGSLGAMAAGPLVAALTASLGWRGCFLVLGTVGLVWAAAWAAWFRPPPGSGAAPASTAPSAGRPAREPFGVILRDRRFWACAAGAASAIPMIHVLGSWVPIYLAETWGLPLGAGLATALVFVYLGLDLGFLASGAAVTLLARRGLSVARARKLVLTVAAGLMLLAAAVPGAPSLTAAVALIAVVNVGRAAYGTLFLALNQEIAPGRVSTIAGLMGSIGSFAGGLLIWVVGVVAKRSGFSTPFLMLAVMAVAGVLPLLITRWEGERR